jgi:hypothetical protein
MRIENKGKVGEKMRQVLLGYRIENGEAKIEEAGANKVRSLFEAYNDSLSIKNAAEKARISGYPTSIGRILKNKRYLGDDYYPAIIDGSTFEKAQQLRMKNAKSMGRIRDYTEDTSEPTEKKTIKFKLGEVTEKHKDPYKQAEFIYSLIETEEEDGE